MHTPRPFLSAILSFSLLSFLQSGLLRRHAPLLTGLLLLIPVDQTVTSRTQGNALSCRLLNRPLKAPIGHQLVDLLRRLVPNDMVKVNHRRMRKATNQTGLLLLELQPLIALDSPVTPRPGLVLRSMALIPTLRILPLLGLSNLRIFVRQLRTPWDQTPSTKKSDAPSDQTAHHACPRPCHPPHTASNAQSHAPSS